MEKPLKNVPVFDETRFLDRVRASWTEAERGQRVIIEWSTGNGPNCFVYPAGRRAVGILMTEGVLPVTNDERWADFLEFDFVPKIVQTLEREGYRPDIICVDLSPMRTQRARRRAIEAAAKAKSGAVH